MTKEDAINTLIKGSDTNKISDGYHTFGELYEHRIELFIALLNAINNNPSEVNAFIWRSKLHSDGSEFEGWFIMGIGEEPGTQITYHLPISKWDDTEFCRTLDRAPIWDGHTSNDVLQRIKNL